MKKFLRFLRFWECWCEDPTHFGDNPECPKHGPAPSLVRMGVGLGVVFLIVIVPTFFK